MDMAPFPRSISFNSDMQEQRRVKHRGPTAAADEEDDYFERLPDDAIIDIFNRVNDSKLLTHCLFLNKRIASLIRLVSSVSIKIHSDPVATLWTSLPFLVLRFKLVITSQDVETVVKSGPFLLEELARLRISRERDELRNFSEVKSLVCEYSKLIEPSWNGELMRWMVEYSTGMIKSCAFLGPIDDIHTVLIWFGCLINYVFTFYPMVVQMAKDHESLCDVLVNVGSGKGWIHAEEDVIAQMRRDSASADEFTKMVMKMMKMINKTILKVKVWYVPVSNESTVYGFVVASSVPDNIDQEVKVATRRFWGDCSYWAGYDDEVIRAGIERNIGELVESTSCDFECVWTARFTGL